MWGCIVPHSHFSMPVPVAICLSVLATSFVMYNDEDHMARQQLGLSLLSLISNICYTVLFLTYRRLLAASAHTHI